jgi:metallophosphoesterase (TIGR00282 family)
MFKIVFLGDIVGKSGRKLIKEELPRLKQEQQADVVIANGENSAGGLGIDPGCAGELFSAGVDLLTTGNHIWSKKEVYAYLDEHSSRIIRPCNYAPGLPGAGFLVWRSARGVSLCVINLLGRVFMPDLLDCPFRCFDSLLEINEVRNADLRFVDFHAEATSEKIAFGYHADSRATAVVGTHTHVQTADERVLPGGCAYITDAGMCGPEDGVIGVSAERILERFRCGLPMRFDLAKGRRQLCAVVISCDEVSGRAVEITRIRSTHE